MPTTSTLRPELTTRVRQQIEDAFTAILEAAQLAEDLATFDAHVADGSVAYLVSAARLVHESGELLAARDEVRR